MFSWLFICLSFSVLLFVLLLLIVFLLSFIFGFLLVFLFILGSFLLPFNDGLDPFGEIGLAILDPLKILDVVFDDP